MLLVKGIYIYIIIYIYISISYPGLHVWNITIMHIDTCIKCCNMVYLYFLYCPLMNKSHPNVINFIRPTECQGKEQRSVDDFLLDGWEKKETRQHTIQARSGS